MSALTGVLLSCLGVYLGGWFMGRWVGNFSLLLAVLTLVTMAYWLAERFYFAPQRRLAAQRLRAQSDSEAASFGASGAPAAPSEQEIQAALAQPWWLDWTAGLFPIILAVFVLRSFVVEPFKIPTGSMIPTLLVDDLILVNKYHYGIRLPVINKKIIAINEPQRGDVMVFRYPLDTRLDYIKRVVGLPGDEVTYKNQQLYINGNLVETQEQPRFYDDHDLKYFNQYSEKLGEVKHNILVEPSARTAVWPLPGFAFDTHCTYSGGHAVTCKVPEGHYFMVGDNRDNSTDSRYWGFVPEKNIVGKAFFIWMSLRDVKRIGPFD